MRLTHTSYSWWMRVRSRHRCWRGHRCSSGNLSELITAECTSMMSPRSSIHCNTATEADMLLHSHNDDSWTSHDCVLRCSCLSSTNRELSKTTTVMLLFWWADSFRRNKKINLDSLRNLLRQTLCKHQRRECNDRCNGLGRTNRAFNGNNGYYTSALRMVELHIV